MREILSQSYLDDLKKIDRHCPSCWELLPDKKIRRKNAVWCSFLCKKNSIKEKYKSKYNKFSINTGKTGAVSELLVCADLLKKGFDVFRSVSQSCPCDMVILKNGVSSRVEVKTAHRTASRLAYGNPKKIIQAEYLALVLHSGEIEYQPEIS